MICVCNSRLQDFATQISLGPVVDSQHYVYKRSDRNVVAAYVKSNIYEYYDAQNRFAMNSGRIIM